MQKLMIIGNLTRDPEGKNMQDGKFVTNFTVAVNRRKTQSNQNPEADFFRVSAWNALGENCQKYLAKGRKVCVIGTVSVHAFSGQDGTAKASLEVLAQDVEFLSPMNSGDQAPAQNAEQDVPVNMTPVEMADGELPF